MTGGILLACPVILWQLWRFIAPGLYRHEKRVLVPFTFLATACFFAGAAFCYYVVFPPAFRFLAGYATEQLQVLPAVKEYFSLALRLLIAFGCVFELPLFMVLLAKMGVVTPTQLAGQRKYAVLVAFVVAAIVTPTPDVVNQCLMAVPLMVLYEVGILAARLAGRKRFRDFADGAPLAADPDA